MGGVRQHGPGVGSCYETLYGFSGRALDLDDGRGPGRRHRRRARGDHLGRPAGSLHSDPEERLGFDGRSVDKGPEPEGLALGKVGGRSYAFVGLERIGGVMVYDVSVPTAPTFVTYANNRDLVTSSGDLGPEGLAFISGDESPTGKPLLAVGNEVSGSTSIFALRKQ